MTGLDVGQPGPATMPGATIGPEGLWAAAVVWLVVNAVNVLQWIGFATRPVAPELVQPFRFVTLNLRILKGVNAAKRS